MKKLSFITALIMLCALFVSCSGKADVAFTSKTLYGRFISLDADTLTVEIGTYAGRGIMQGAHNRFNSPMDDMKPSDMQPPMGLMPESDVTDSSGETQVFIEEDNRENGFVPNDAANRGGMFTGCGVILSFNTKSANITGSDGEAVSDIEKDSVLEITLSGDTVQSVKVLSDTPYSFFGGDDVMKSGFDNKRNP
ncbi:MAG: hypothetical protein IJO93_04520 [Clostridia bacterium]|nr:hypothetical protein [Clostridia bacterium]